MSTLKNNKELQVAAIENGTVIDHIPPTQLFKVASLVWIKWSIRLPSPIIFRAANVEEKE